MEDLALIILNYNSAGDTIFCVKQLLSFNSNFRIIIVDNQSSDNSYAEIQSTFSEYTCVDILQSSSNRGYSAGNNLGMMHAAKDKKIKIIGILNPDVVIPELKVLIKMKNTLTCNEKYAVIGGIGINANNEYNPNFSFWDIPSSLEIVKDHLLLNNRFSRVRNLRMLEDKIAQVECVAGCFFLAKLSVIQELGFLDENVFLYNEENILGIKCKKKGYMELVALDQFYIHNHKPAIKKKTWKKIVSAQKIGYQSRKYLCKTYYSTWLLPALWIVEALNRIYLLLAYLKNRI